MTHPTRRQFLGHLGMAASSLFVAGLPATSCAPRTQDPKGIALQLWSVRREIEADLKGTLDRIARIGFTGVETAFFPDDLSPEQAGILLRDAGLTVVAVHCELPIGEQRDEMPRLAEAYGCHRMVWHGWPEDPRYLSPEGTRELADLYNESLHYARSQGLQFGLHNHWWEFQPQPDGRLPWEVLLAHIDDDIFLELDTYWARLAGRDPVAWLKQWAPRIPLLHLKDGPVISPDDAMVALGTGQQDIPGILQAANAAEWLIVEFDECETDLFAALEQSHRYLTDRGY